VPRWAATLPLLAALLAGVALAQGVTWVSYEEAMKLAPKEGKPIYLYFYSRSCPYCAMMEDTFRDPAVVRLLNERFVAVRVDVGQRPDLADLYGIMGTPTHVFLCPNGTLIGWALSYRDPAAFVKLLNTALEKGSERCSGGRGENASTAKGGQEVGAPLSVLASFAIGAVTPLTPCVLPLLPALYLLASRGGRGGLAAFSLGLFTAYSLASLAAGHLLLMARSAVEPAAYALLLLAGLALAVERVGKALSAALSPLARRLSGARTRSAFLLGGATSVLWGPCVAPMAGAALALSALAPTPALSALTNLTFAGGLSLSTYALARALRGARGIARRARALRAVNRALGAAMVAAALLHFAGVL